MESKSIGALWKRTSKGGFGYLAGNIQVDGKTIKLVVFENSAKKEAKHPDYKMFLSEPREAPKEETAEDPF